MATLLEYPIDGILDLHTFRPGEIHELVPDYLDLCRENRIYQIRIIHGKGSGTLRRIVHSILDKRTDVRHYALANTLEGGWGATVVDMEPSRSQSQPE